MRRTITIALFALTTLFSTSVAFAQDDDNVQVIEIEDGLETIGERGTPEDVFRAPIGELELDSLIRLRANFNDRLTDSVEDF